MRITETISDYIYYLKHVKEIKDTTLRNIIISLKKLVEWLQDKDIEDVTMKDIIRFKIFLQNKNWLLRNWQKSKNLLSEAYIHNTMIRVKSFFTWLKWEWYAVSIKPNDIKLKRYILSNPEYYTKDEIHLLFQELEKWLSNSFKKRLDRYNYHLWRAMMYLYYYSWLRNSWLRTILTKNIDLENLRGKTIEKGDIEYGFTFHNKAKQAILEYLEIKKEFDVQSPYLFVRISNRKVQEKFTPTHLNFPNWFLKCIGERAWITKPLHIHIFRHTCATHLLDAWANIREVQQKLNHKNLDTTMLYTHVSNPRLQEITQNLLQ